MTIPNLWKKKVPVNGNITINHSIYPLLIHDNPTINDYKSHVPVTTNQLSATLLRGTPRGRRSPTPGLLGETTWNVEGVELCSYNYRIESIYYMNYEMEL